MTDLQYLAAPGGKNRELPNVVKLEIPHNHRVDGAAWVYVPSKDTIYIGDQGSEALELADALRHVIDVKKGEKLINGIQYDDGYSDYFTATDDDLGTRLLSALNNYHSQTTGENGRSQTDDWGTGYDNYDYLNALDYEADDDDDDNLSLDEWLEKQNAKWQKGALPSGDDYDKGKIWKHYERGDPSLNPLSPSNTPQGGDLKQWTEQELKAWKGENPDTGWGGTPREDNKHFRWSFGDKANYPQAPHDGLFMWPTKGGYPAHYDQTGDKGLGWCSQGRVYPHTNGRYEVLTWIHRPRYVSDLSEVHEYQLKAQEACKEWLMENLHVPEDKIFFTVGDYGQYVSTYDSPSYPGWQRSFDSDITPGKALKDDDIHYDDDDASAVPKKWNDLKESDEQFPAYDPEVWSSYPEYLRAKYKEILSQDPIPSTHVKIPASTPPEGWTMEEWAALTPEDRWVYQTQRFKDNDGKGRTPDDMWVQEQAQIPVGERPKPQTKTVNNGPPRAPFDDYMTIKDNNGHTYTITEDDYLRAVQEDGPDYWWKRWLKPDQPTAKVGAVVQESPATIDGNGAHGSAPHYYSCFGYVDGILYLGRRHHMAIMQVLTEQAGKGWSWLMQAPQIWGWLFKSGESPELDRVRFSTDAARLDDDVRDDAIAALTELYGHPFEDAGMGRQTNETYAPKYDDTYNSERGYTIETAINVGVYKPSFYKPKGMNTPERPDWLPEGLEMVPTQYNPSYGHWKEAAVEQTAEAFLWVDGKLHWGKAHWMIVDKLWGKDLAEWVYANQVVPIVGGWMWEGDVADADNYDEEGRLKAIIELWSEFAPEKQNHIENPDVIPRVVEDIENDKWVKIVDLETPDQPPRILERFTPTVNQGKSPVDYGDPSGRADLASEPAKPTGITKLKQTDLGNGVSVSTVDLRAFGGEYETAVFGIDEFKNDQWTDATSDQALLTHQTIVDAINHNFTLPSDNKVAGAVNLTEMVWSVLADNRQLQLFDAPGLSVIPITPEENEGHSNGEKPFIYYKPLDTLFEATRDCHHAHIIPKMEKMIAEYQGQMHTPDSMNPGNYIWGDITDPDLMQGRNWIKFISGWPIPEKVVNYFLGKYPDRDLMYSGEDGWDHLDKEQLDKTALKADPDYWSTAGLNPSGCFGYINGTLLLGTAHHQQIMAKLLENGWTWMDLMSVPQAWGWYGIRTWGVPAGAITPIEIRFTSDAGTQDPESQTRAGGAFAALYKLPVHVIEGNNQNYGVDNNPYGFSQYGRPDRFERNYGEQGGRRHVLDLVQGEIPKPPVQEVPA